VTCRSPAFFSPAGDEALPDRPPSRSSRLSYLCVPSCNLRSTSSRLKAGGLLALRILREGRQEFADVGLRRDQQVDVIDQPIVVGVRGDVRALEGVRAEIEQLWHAKGDERLGPDPGRAGLSLFQEYQLPIVVPQRDELPVVVAVNESRLLHARRSPASTENPGLRPIEPQIHRERAACGCRQPVRSFVFAGRVTLETIP
jgi:hypothetical protein